MYLPDLGRRSVSRSTRRAALGVALFLVLIAAIAFGAGGVRTTPSFAFLPVVITLAFCAEALTALLLFGQFYLTGSIGFALIACAYEFAALLAIPYLASAPGVGPDLGGRDAGFREMAWLWTAWHLAFPAAVIAGFALDPLLKRRMSSRREIGASLAFVCAFTAVIAVLVATLAWGARDVLPHLVAGGQPTPAFRFGVVPSVVLANTAACAYALLRGKGATSLGIWIALASFAATLGALVETFSGHAFSLPWYLAELEAMLTASIVLAMLAIEIGLVYGRLAELATRDALTGLHNRRGLDDYLRWAFEYARRRELGIAILMVDIDHFKQYNDRYGHSTGDAALRRVAALLRKSAVRRYDLVARYGGEEFVVALFNVGPHQATLVAERLQRLVQGARIPHAAVDSGRLSVSIGIGHVGDAARASVEELFQAADGALYRAKDAGRDRYMLATID
jgi:diguanylate cyclase (GGDEF)-like protein